MSIHVCKCEHKGRTEYHLRYPGLTEHEAQELAARINAGWLTDPHAPARWRAIELMGPPEPEVFVLCWDGKRTFVEWFGSKPDAGRGVTHWIPYALPPGADSDMHDGRRAFLREAGHE